MSDWNSDDKKKLGSEDDPYHEGDRYKIRGDDDLEGSFYLVQGEEEDDGAFHISRQVYVGDDPFKHGLKNEGAEYYEYECGSYCTQDGCMGHVTNIPLSIRVNGITFWVEGVEGGDFPSSLQSKEEIEHVRKVVRALEELIKKRGKDIIK